MLIVEDYAETRALRAFVAMSNRCEVLEAADGKTAVELARREKPDLILMDLNLPRMNGWTATQKIASDAETRQIPVVAVAERFGKDERLRRLAVRCGARECVEKPIDFRSFDNLIARYAERLSF